MNKITIVLSHCAYSNCHHLKEKTENYLNAMSLKRVEVQNLSKQIKLQTAESIVYNESYRYKRARESRPDIKIRFKCISSPS